MQLVYNFKEGNRDMKALLGGKGANLAEMTSLGLNVPPGFTLTTEACQRYNQDPESGLWKELKDGVLEEVKKLEAETGKGFGDETHPLLFSVRSGAAESMPGMMDTVLNLGLNDQSVVGLAKSTENDRFAYDSYRRFIQMFADVVKGVPLAQFEYLLENRKKSKGVEEDTDLDAQDMIQLVQAYKARYQERVGESFPQDPMDQLFEAVEAVFASWNNDRAVLYREINEITGLLGTAVNVQTMVFGNMGPDSGTGVMFTRNPANGQKELFGEYLINAQGEDVVAGVRTPQAIASLNDDMPDLYQELETVAQKLESHYLDMQDIEFTIENRHLYLLQTRTGKRTAQAAIKIANDLFQEGLITAEDSVTKLTSQQLETLMHPRFDPDALDQADKIGQGLAASPGAAVGRVCFSVEAVESTVQAGDSAILVRRETSPEDLAGMVKAAGVLTSRGGMTSHAAVVARGMGKCCVAGCSDIKVDSDHGTFTYQGGQVREGDYISIDGSTGSVYLGQVAMSGALMDDQYDAFMDRVNDAKRMAVRTNADTPKDVQAALDFGAEGIGLVRTEHMFFGQGRISEVRKMILAKSREDRQIYVDRLYQFQKEDFVGIYQVTQSLPVTVRLLDPPLHEFLPHEDQAIQAIAQDMDLSREEVAKRIELLQEVNPMLGHRGVRLGISYPEVTAMQVSAIIDAAIEVKQDRGYDIKPEIMVPLVGQIQEFKQVKDQIEVLVQDRLEETGVDLDYSIGTMIEIPRACLIADQLAQEADFFSFGTNDLTQMTFGYSRDDAGSFIPTYIENGIMEEDPFKTIDQEGVGAMVKLAVDKARSVKPDIKLGICGEHGGDAKSIHFFDSLGLDYVSCSPYRVPIARLAAAQASQE